MDSVFVRQRPAPAGSRRVDVNPEGEVVAFPSANNKLLRVPSKSRNQHARIPRVKDRVENRLDKLPLADGRHTCSPPSNKSDREALS